MGEILDFPRGAGRAQPTTPTQTRKRRTLTGEDFITLVQAITEAAEVRAVELDFHRPGAWNSAPLALLVAGFEAMRKTRGEPETERALRDLLAVLDRPPEPPAA